jgi:prevent-host-death family protein
MKSMSVTLFKTHALRVLDRISRTREPLIITKRGKPFAQVIPYQQPSTLPTPGRLADCLIFEKDIVTPLGEDMWEAGR